MFLSTLYRFRNSACAPYYFVVGTSLHDKIVISYVTCIGYYPLANDWLRIDRRFNQL